MVKYETHIVIEYRDGLITASGNWYPDGTYHILNN